MDWWRLAEHWAPMMSAEGGGSGGQGGQQGGGQGGQEGGGQQGGGGNTETEQDRINKAAAAARRAAESEAATARDKSAQDLGYKDHADMLTQVKALKDKDLTESQKVAKERDEAKARETAALERSNRIAVNAELKVLAASKDFGIDPDVALAMIDRTNIKVADDGTVSGAKEALEALKTAKPGLFGEAGGGEGAGGSLGKGGGKTTKTPAEIAAEIGKERTTQVTSDPWADKK